MNIYFTGKIKVFLICIVPLLIKLSFVPFLITSCSNKNHDSLHQVKQEIKEEWTCPMHPQILTNAPGQCPICHMDLVKKNISKSTTDSSTTNSNTNMPHNHTTIELTKEKQQLIGVKSSITQKKELFKTIEVAGRVAFDPDLYAAQSEYIEAIKQQVALKDSSIENIKKSADAMVESAKMRLKILGISDGQIQKLSNQQQTGTKYLVQQKGEPIWIYADIFEMDLSSVIPKQKVEIFLQSLNRYKIEGEVVSIDRVINPATRTAKARILVNEKSLKNEIRNELRPESFVEVNILVSLGEHLVVPFDAIFDSGKEKWAFVIKNDGVTIEPRKILISTYANDEAAIESGIDKGERIVTSANFLIDSESRLKAINSDNTIDKTQINENINENNLNIDSHKGHNR